MTRDKKIDEFDSEILDLIQQSNRIPSDRIAEEIGLSPASVKRSLKRMRDVTGYSGLKDYT